MFVVTGQSGSTITCVAGVFAASLPSYLRVDRHRHVASCGQQDGSTFDLSRISQAINQEGTRTRGAVGILRPKHSERLPYFLPPSFFFLASNAVSWACDKVDAPAVLLQFSCSSCVD